MKHELAWKLGLATAIAGVGIACRSAEDPFTSGPAAASVTGIVTSSTGAPLAAVTIHILCDGGGAPVDVTTDGSGHYGASLDSGLDPFDGESGRLRCAFVEPATGPVRVEVDTALGFARGPVLRVLQRVDLREH